MPRSARIAPGGMIFHVLNRATVRLHLFRKEKDFLAFESVLEEACIRWPGVRLLGWCIMRDHWHLMLHPTRDGEMKTFMHWLTLTHAARWRTSHRTVGYGPLYQGRYRSFAVQEDKHFLTVLRYVERNPLRAKCAKHAVDWRWSSAFVRRGNESLLAAYLREAPVNLPRNWLAMLETLQPLKEEESIVTAIKRSRPFGHERFQRRTATKLGLISCFNSPGRPRRKTPKTRR